MDLTGLSANRHAFHGGAPYMLGPAVLPSIHTCASTLATCRAPDSLSNGRMEFSNTIFFFLSEIL